ncbi:hypothetical protein FRB97_006075 [Tulasnella sp. 331]|nr:hypothetical protein FRB97_006075 [Tulasnella sp. 331]
MSYDARSISDEPSSIPLEPLTFGGAPNEDVTAFLGAVKRIVVVQGRRRDDEWIVDFVESCLRGDAMRWFDGLESSAPLEWSQLRRLFLAKFNNYNISPINAPAPAPSPAARLPVHSAPTAPLPSAVNALFGGEVRTLWKASSQSSTHAALVWSGLVTITSPPGLDSWRQRYA